MDDKKKKGRKKKFNDLVKASFYIERELNDQINELAELTNKFKGVDSITFSIIARQCLVANIPKMLKGLKERIGESASSNVSEETRKQAMNEFYNKKE